MREKVFEYQVDIGPHLEIDKCIKVKVMGLDGKDGTVRVKLVDSGILAKLKPLKGDFSPESPIVGKLVELWPTGEICFGSDRTASGEVKRTTGSAVRNTKNL
jgi:hypothetical protein